MNFLNLIPEDSILVSESGIGSKKDLDTLNNKGINNFLIGEFLMTSNDRISKIKELLE